MAAGARPQVGQCLGQRLLARQLDALQGMAGRTRRAHLRQTRPGSLERCWPCTACTEPSNTSARTWGHGCRPGLVYPGVWRTPKYRRTPLPGALPPASEAARSATVPLSGTTTVLHTPKRFFTGTRMLLRCVPVALLTPRARVWRQRAPRPACCGKRGRGQAPASRG